MFNTTNFLGASLLLLEVTLNIYLASTQRTAFSVFIEKMLNVASRKQTSAKEVMLT